MSKQTANEKLSPHTLEICSLFAAQQSTITQLAFRYKVGPETMRHFLKAELGEEYAIIVQEIRSRIQFDWHESMISDKRLSNRMLQGKEGVPHRTKKDFSPEELKAIQLRLEHRTMVPQVNYHPYIVDPLVGDIE